ncbi:MAG: glycosyltransferase family 39 protein [Planctomycetota bacterium]|nr:glycosyltransferase family 39 protein [Planctomycetota bacterium]
MHRIPRPLLAAAILYALFRAVVVATSFDAVAIPVYEVPNMGNQAWLLQDGFRGVPWSYYYDNAGGQLLTAVLAAPLYALFGSSYLTLKLVPFLMGLAIMGLIWRFLSQNVNRTAAVIGVFLFALGPPTLTKYSLLAKGNHFEGLLFLFVPVVLIFEASRRERRTPWLIGAGLTAGFSVVVYYGSLLALSLLAPVQLRLRGVRGALQDLRFLLPSAALGLLPLAGLQRMTGGRAGFFADKFTSVDPQLDAGGMWSEARSLLVDTLPGGACFEALGPIPALVGEWLLLLALVGSWGALVARACRRADAGDGAQRAAGGVALLIAAYLPLVLGVIAIGVLKIRSMPPPVEIGGVRYLVSFYFFGVLGIAAACGPLLASRRGSGQRFGVAVLTCAAATTLFVLPIASAHFDRASDGVRYPGTFFRNYGSLIQRGAVKDPATGKLSLVPGEVMGVADDFSGERREDVLLSTGNSLAYGTLAQEGTLDLDRLLEGYPTDAVPHLLRGVGCYLRGSLPRQGPAPPRLQEVISLVLHHPEHRERVAEGMGMSLAYPLRRTFADELVRTARSLAAVPADLRLAIRRGQGADLGLRARRGLTGIHSRLEEVLENVDDPAEREALRGAIEASATR